MPEDLNIDSNECCDARALRTSELLSEIAQCYASLDSIRIQNDLSLEEEKNKNRLLLVTRTLPIEEGLLEKNNLPLLNNNVKNILDTRIHFYHELHSEQKCVWVGGYSTEMEKNDMKTVQNTLLQVRILITYNIFMHEFNIDNISRIMIIIL